MGEVRGREPDNERNCLSFDSKHSCNEVPSMNVCAPAMAPQLDIERLVRNRIFIALEHHLRVQSQGTRNCKDLFAELRDTLLGRYGVLSGHEQWLSDRTRDPVLLHYFTCDSTQFIQFVELAFRTTVFACGGEQSFVETLNGIFRECNIGYEFTRWSVQLGDPIMIGNLVTRARPERIEHPRAMRCDQSTQHETVIRPCLELLSDPRFAAAGAELRKARDEFRAGRYTDALTSCGAAFESTLKTICTQKLWSYDADRAGCSNLIHVCKTNGLFPPFYAPMLEAVGTVRNKLGDAHGKGPAMHAEPDERHVKHMIQMTSTHILFLVALAEL